MRDQAETLSRNAGEPSDGRLPLQERGGMRLRAAMRAMTALRALGNVSHLCRLFEFNNFGDLMFTSRALIGKLIAAEPVREHSSEYHSSTTLRTTRTRNYLWRNSGK